METTLHRQLKEKFREPGSQIEVKLGRYRIDVVNGKRLVEIQQSGLAAIRDKIRRLVCDHEVDVVKPLVTRKRLVKLARKNGRETERRWSPKQCTILNVFDELLYFTRVFPHPNLRLIVPLVEIEEIRYPGHGRRRRRRSNDFVIEDRRLTKIVGIHIFQNGSCLHRLLPDELESPFDTGQLARGLSVHRHEAQRIAYVMNKTGTAERVGKKGNAFLYQLTPDAVDATERESKTKPSQKKKTARKKAEPAKAIEKKAAGKHPAKKTARKKVASKKSVSRKAISEKTIGEKTSCQEPARKKTPRKKNARKNAA